MLSKYTGLKLFFNEFAIILHLYRLKQKSKKMAKRISFSLKAKQCAANRPTTEPSNLLSKELSLILCLIIWNHFVSFLFDFVKIL